MGTRADQLEPEPELVLVGGHVVAAGTIDMRPSDVLLIKSTSTGISMVIIGKSTTGREPSNYEIISAAEREKLIAEFEASGYQMFSND